MKQDELLKIMWMLLKLQDNMQPVQVIQRW